VTGRADLGGRAVVDGNDRVAAAMSVVVPTTVEPLRLAPAAGTAALCASRALRDR
jgi:hypothetical protein